MIIGRFYLKLTNNGNLIGEYSNNDILIIITESADRCQKSLLSTFIGDYNTTWIEDNFPEHCNLKIEYKADTLDLIYSLTWTRVKDDKLIFKGEGFIVDSILIGNYQSTD